MLKIIAAGFAAIAFALTTAAGASATGPVSSHPAPVDEGTYDDLTDITDDDGFQTVHTGSHPAPVDEGSHDELLDILDDDGFQTNN